MEIQVMILLKYKTYFKYLAIIFIILLSYNINVQYDMYIKNIVKLNDSILLEQEIKSIAQYKKPTLDTLIKIHSGFSTKDGNIELKINNEEPNDTYKLISDLFNKYEMVPFFIEINQDSTKLNGIIKW